MHTLDCLVVGAGVVGLAVARALATAGVEVVVLEAADAIGTGASSRNSEVIHAGLYYAPGSLRATLCVRGREMLYDYCAARSVAFRRCGKLIVATSAHDVHHLERIAMRAVDSGVSSLTGLSRDAAREMEPALECEAALWSPDTGIIDSHGLMSALRADAEAAGAVVVLHTGFSTARDLHGVWHVTTDDAARSQISARWIVNCAGLDAQSVAARIVGFPPDQIPAQHIAKGHYFALSGPSPFSHLVYPTPSDGGLGIHLTLDLAGQARFGPDVEWLPPSTLRDYRVDVSRTATFEHEIRRYWPALPHNALHPAYAGLRTKLSGPGEPAADFRIDGPGVHSVPGVIHCFGIESPGLTASLAIGEYVRDTIRPMR